MEEAAKVEAKKPKTEVTPVQMEDGRIVGFPGARKLQKEVLIDREKIQMDKESGAVMFAPGAVSLRFDWRHGATRTFLLPTSLYPEFVGHGGSQKYGDELAVSKEKAAQMSEEDYVLSVEDLDKQIQAGDWSAARESGGFSGASVVIRAIMEASGKDQAYVKDYLQKRLDGAKAKGEELSRAQLYKSFRNPKSQTGVIIARMELEAASKGNSVDADEELAALKG